MSEEPNSLKDLEAALFNASGRLPVSIQPLEMVKALDPDMTDALYLSGDCSIRRAVSMALDLSDTVLGQSTGILRHEMVVEVLGI